MARKQHNHDSSKEHAHSNAADSFFSQHKKKIYVGLTILLLIIPLWLAFYARTANSDLAVAETWARSTVENQIKSQIASAIAQQYPNLPQSNRDPLINENWAQYYEQNQQEIENQISQAAEYYKSRMQDESGQTYLTAIDPYQYLRYTEDMVEQGYPGDEKTPSGSWDHHMLAPIGVPVTPNFHIFIGSLLYKIVSMFTDISVMTLVFYVPVLFASLAVIPAFFIARHKGGLVGGFTAAVLVGVHTGFVQRTAAGFSDTDAYAVLFPLLCAWFFLEAMASPIGEWKKRITYLLLCGASFGLLAWAWVWWYFYALFFYLLIGHFIYTLIRKFVAKPDVSSIIDYFRSPQFRWFLVMLFGFVVAVGIFVVPQSSLISFLDAPLQPFSTSTSFKAAVAQGSIWPNVLTTVAELNAPSIAGIIGNIGGTSLFLLSLIGMVFTLVPDRDLKLKHWLFLISSTILFLILIHSGTSLSIRMFLIIMALPTLAGFLLLLRDPGEVDTRYALLLVIWIAASVFTMTQGIRFVLLLIPPFAIAAGIAIGMIFRFFKRWLSSLDFRYGIFFVAVLLLPIIRILSDSWRYVLFSLGIMGLIAAALIYYHSTQNKSRQKVVTDIVYNKRWVIPALFLIFSLILIKPATDGISVGEQQVPSMTDAWWESLTQIKEQSAPDAIINSWWDFGHWFKYVADRAVTFDGASQTTPNAHWIGRALLTADEKEALAILRMVDCGNYLGVEDVQAGIPDGDLYAAVTLTKQIIMQNPSDARATLQGRGFSDAQIDTVLNHTHCQPPENYFITSGDMVGKAGVWGHFGAWDFMRADAYQNFRLKQETVAIPAMVLKYNISEDDATRMYIQMQALADENEANSWVAPWPGYPHNWQGCQRTGNETFSCMLNIQVNQQQGAMGILRSINLNTSDYSQTRLDIVFVDAQGRQVGQNNDVQPTGLYFVTNETNIESISFNGSTSGQSFLIDMVNGNPARAMIVDPLHAQGMFTRLFFLNGKSTIAFEKFSDMTTFTGTRIIVWKVDWSKLEDFDLA